ncbi:hypothetical protein SALWKB12_2259 [Snodgrassella communis]|nr:hypothetical protein SALWKB12_2259 [Snodgrassella communis]
MSLNNTASRKRRHGRPPRPRPHALALPLHSLGDESLLLQPAGFSLLDLTVNFILLAHSSK